VCVRAFSWLRLGVRTGGLIGVLMRVSTKGFVPQSFIGVVGWLDAIFDQQRNLNNRACWVR
jgi:hypothetical protein